MFGGVPLKARFVATVLLFCLSFSMALAQEPPPSLVFSFWGNSVIMEKTLEGLEKFAIASQRTGRSAASHSFESREAYMDWLFHASDTEKLGDVIELDAAMFQALTMLPSESFPLISVEDFPKQLLLNRFSYEGLSACLHQNQVMAVPVSLTSHMFFWNVPALKALQVQAPATTEELLTLTQSLSENEAVYPLAANAESRIALLITLLQSRYGKPWVDEKNCAPNFTVAQAAEGFAYLRSLETAKAWPSLSAQKNPEEGFAKGEYLGIWGWDADVIAGLQSVSVEAKQTSFLTHFSDWGDYAGGFQQPLRMFAIPKSAQEPTQSAGLIEFLLNSRSGAQALGDSRGMPLSREGLSALRLGRLLDSFRASANKSALSWARYPLPLGFFDKSLVGSGGVYEKVLLALPDLSDEVAAEMLLLGFSVALE